MPNKDEIITAILKLELDMFLTVPTNQPYSCQRDPEGFRLHRGAQFSIWAEDTLESYLADLRHAKQDGVNLMTVKYARMGNLIPKKNFNPLIEKIVVLNIDWQKEIIKKYPNLMAGGRQVSPSDDSIIDTSFETYLRGELETYSDATLALLHRDLAQLFNEGINGSMRIYENLTKRLGYESIEAADQAKKV